MSNFELQNAAGDLRKKHLVKAKEAFVAELQKENDSELAPPDSAGNVESFASESGTAERTKGVNDWGEETLQQRFISAEETDKKETEKNGREEKVSHTRDWGAETVQERFADKERPALNIKGETKVETGAEKKTEATKEKDETKEKEMGVWQEKIGTARVACAQDWYNKDKSSAEVSKLDNLREKVKGWAVRYFAGHKEPEYQAKKTAQSDAVKTDFEKRQEAFIKSRADLGAVLKDYRAYLLAQKEAELAASGKKPAAIEKELEQFAKGIAMETTTKEAVALYKAKEEAQIAAEGEKNKWAAKALEVGKWYRNLPPKTKIAVGLSMLAVGTGAAAVGGATGAAMLAALAVGRVPYRVLGGMATGLGFEAGIKARQEKYAEKELGKEFAGKFLETLKQQGGALDEKLFELAAVKKGEERRRYALSGTVGVLIGSGAAAEAFRNVWHAGEGALHSIAEKFSVGKSLPMTEYTLGENEITDKFPSGGKEVVLPRGGAPIGSSAYSQEQLETALKNFDKLPPLEQHKMQLWNALVERTGRAVTSEELEAIFRGQKLGVISADEMQDLISKMKQGNLSSAGISKIIGVSPDELMPADAKADIISEKIGKKIYDLATVGKGQGIEHALIRQLEYNPKGMGCPEEIIAKGKEAIKGWAGQQAHKIALEQGYVKVGADGKTIETWVRWNEKNPAKFLLERDAGTDKFSVQEMDAKTFEKVIEKGTVGGLEPTAVREVPGTGQHFDGGEMSEVQEVPPETQPVMPRQPHFEDIAPVEKPGGVGPTIIEPFDNQPSSGTGAGRIEPIDIKSGVENVTSKGTFVQQIEQLRSTATNNTFLKYTGRSFDDFLKSTPEQQNSMAERIQEAIKKLEEQQQSVAVQQKAMIKNNLNGLKSIQETIDKLKLFDKII